MFGSGQETLKKKRKRKELVGSRSSHLNSEAMENHWGHSQGLSRCVSADGLYSPGEYSAKPYALASREVRPRKQAPDTLGNGVG